MSYVVYNGQEYNVIDGILRLEYKSIKDISEIQGLDKLSNLHELYLSGNQITEIKGLDALVNLKKLYLIGNQITEIKGLESLTELQLLYLKRNEITKIKELKELKNLKILNLGQNQISKIEGLHDLTSLQELFLNKNQITDIQGLNTLKNLKRLFLSENGIKEIKGLDTLTALEDLSLPNNQISKINGLENLSKLEQLTLSGNQISEIKGLEKLTSLILLNLDENQISEIKGLDYLKNLETLGLSFNSITEIKGLINQTMLKSLNLIFNKITEIKELDSLQNLLHLYLSFNKITGIQGLEHLTNLVILNLANNQISKIKGLNTLYNLDILQLSNNKITEIGGLKDLENLRMLDLSRNQITEIKRLERLTRLRELSLSENPLKNSSEELMVKKSSNAQEFVTYCKFKKRKQIRSFDFEEKKLKQLTKDDISFFIEIGTHKEDELIKLCQNQVFLEQSVDEITLSENDFSFKDIVIHLFQMHSLKGINVPDDKVEYFMFFINNFWDNGEIERNKVLMYKRKYKYRVKRKIEEILDLSIKTQNKKLNSSRPDLIIFPENSIPHSIINFLKKFSKVNSLIIIGGLEHIKVKNEYFNQAIIIDNGKTNFQIKQTPVWIHDAKKKRLIIENIKCETIPKIKVFKTSLGRIAIFICKDFLRLCDIIPSWAKKNHIDFIVIPSLTSKVMPFHTKLIQLFNNPDCEKLKFIFNNVGEYGGSELFSVEDIRRIEKANRTKQYDNFGETIIIREGRRLKSKYLKLVDKEMEKFRSETEKYKKLQEYREKIESDQIPYILKKDISIGWRETEPFLTKTEFIKFSNMYRTKWEGYCIRCGQTIDFIPERPYCFNHWKIWNQENNPDYQEEYCHQCGEPYQATRNKPLCSKCEWS